MKNSGWPKWSALLLLAAFLIEIHTPAYSEQQTAANQALDARRDLPEVHAGLQEALVQIAKVYHLATVIELGQPLPSVRIPAGTMSARQALALVAKSDVGYDWRLHGSVIHFYDKKLRIEPLNFLNWRLDKFAISGTVADVDLRLKSELNKLRDRVIAEGGLIVGLRPTELARDRLPTVVLRDVTARQVLFRVADMNPHFYTVVVFPRRSSVTRADLDQAFANWRWAAVEAEH